VCRNTLKTIAENLEVGNPVPSSFGPSTLPRINYLTQLESLFAITKVAFYPIRIRKVSKVRLLRSLLNSVVAASSPLILYGLWKYRDRYGDRPQNLRQLANWRRLFSRLVGTSGLRPAARVGHQSGIESVRCRYRGLGNLPRSIEWISSFGE